MPVKTGRLPALASPHPRLARSHLAAGCGAEIAAEHVGGNSVLLGGVAPSPVRALELFLPHGIAFP